jgi:hypothetical protein
LGFASKKEGEEEAGRRGKVVVKNTAGSGSLLRLARMDSLRDFSRRIVIAGTVYGYAILELCTVCVRLVACVHPTVHLV